MPWVNVEDVPKQIGDEFIKTNGCPKCKSDLIVTFGIAVMCVNWQHPDIPEMYMRGGNRNCDYAILAG